MISTLRWSFMLDVYQELLSHFIFFLFVFPPCYFCFVTFFYNALKCISCFDSTDFIHTRISATHLDLYLTQGVNSCPDLHINKAGFDLYQAVSCFDYIPHGNYVGILWFTMWYKAMLWRFVSLLNRGQLLCNCCIYVLLCTVAKSSDCSRQRVCSRNGFTRWKEYRVFLHCQQSSLASETHRRKHKQPMLTNQSF